MDAFDHVNAPLTIDQGHVKSHRRQHVMTFGFHELLCGKRDPVHLGRAQRLCGFVVGAGRLHFDEDMLFSILGNKVDFCGSHATTAIGNLRAHGCIVLLNQRFCPRIVQANALHDVDSLSALAFELFFDATLPLKKVIPELKVKVAYNFPKDREAYDKEIRARYNQPWIEFRNDVLYTENALDFYKELKVVVIPRPNHDYLHLAMPSKLFDAMAVGRPLVVTRLKEQAAIVENEHCGLVCDFNPADMADKIGTLLSDESLAETMGKNGRAAIEEHHGWDFRAKEILEFIQPLAR